jgi:hypothetical protein
MLLRLVLPLIPAVSRLVLLWLLTCLWLRTGLCLRASLLGGV